VIGQCFHYALARPIVNRMAVVDYTDASLIDDLTDHITGFSLAGIQAMHSRLTAAKAAHPPASPAKGGKS
jgi:hypothetical protein